MKVAEYSKQLKMNKGKFASVVESHLAEFEGWTEKLQIIKTHITLLELADH